MQRKIWFSAKLTALMLSAAIILALIPATVYGADNKALSESKDKVSSIMAEKTAVAKRTLCLDVHENDIIDTSGQVLIPTADGIYDMLDSEGWKWNPTTKTLTLNGFHVEVTDRCGILFPAGTTIELIGTNSATSTDSLGLQMEGDGDLTINGTGSLTINSKSSNIMSKGDIIINSGTIDAKSTGESSLWAWGGDIKISGSANVSAESEPLCALRATDKGIFISGGTVNITSKNDAAAYTEGKLEISGSAKVTATGKYRGLQANKNIEIAGGVVEARSTDDAAVWAKEQLIIGGTGTSKSGKTLSTDQLKVQAEGKTVGLLAAGDVVMSNGTVEAKSTGDAAIKTNQNLTVNENAKVQAISKDSQGLRSQGKMYLAGTIEAKSDAGIAILSNGKMTLDKKNIHAVGASGFPAIAVLYTKVSETTPPIMIELINGADTLENVKLAASDWLGQSSDQSYTAFIPKNEDRLDITATGSSSNAATEVTIEKPAPTPTPDPVYLSSIKVDTPPAKTDYYAGETFDKTGMKITAVYSNGNTYDVTDQYTFKPDGPLTTEDKEIIISYGSLTVKQPITVSVAGVETATIKTPPAKCQYNTGETFDPAGLVVELTYENGEKKDIAYDEKTKDQFTFEPTLNTPLATANKEITIHYKEQVLKQAITVVSKIPESITLSKKTAALSPGQTLKLKATVKPADAQDKTVTWTSSNSKVAKVSQKGTVTAVAKGSAVIAAKTISGKKATCKVAVTFDPPALKKETVNNTTLALSWKAVKGADGYQVYRATSSKGTYVKVKTTGKTTYTDGKLIGGKTYYYKVRAYSKVTGITGYTGFSKVVPAKIKKSCPCGQDHSKAWFKLKQSGKSTVKVTWTPQKGAISYQVANNQTSNKAIKIKWTGNNKQHCYLSMGKAKGKNYQFKMRTVTVKNGKKVYGSWTSKVCITMK